MYMCVCVNRLTRDVMQLQKPSNIILNIITKYNQTSENN